MYEMQSKSINRRVFLKSLASLGALAALSTLTSCINKVTSASATNSPPVPPPAIPLQAQISKPDVIVEESSQNQTAETAAAVYPPLAVLYRTELKEYDFGPGSLYRGQRYGSFFHYLRENLQDKGHYEVLKADFASDEDLSLICNSDLIAFNKRFYSPDNSPWTVTDEFHKYQTIENKPVVGSGRVEMAARLVVGQAKMAADLVLTGQFKKPVSVGGGMHHAFRDHGEAFCIYNDVAFCAEYLLEKYGLERILILDLDAHAGNGTSSYFNDDPRVLLIDAHQDPKTIYPGTGFVDQIGTGAGTGYTVNLPMPEDANYGCYEMAFESIIEPLTQEFKPQIIVWNGGADTHAADPETNLGLKTEDFKKVGVKVHNLAEICDGKAIRLIVSGYTPKILPLAWYGSVVGFAGFETADTSIPSEVSPEASLLYSRTNEMLVAATRKLRPYWKSLR